MKNCIDILNNLELSELLAAYYDCRKKKRRTLSALRFEINYERNLYRLWRDIVSKRYHIRPSSAFIVTYPVRREVFAASFRDRIVHHLVINRIMAIMERIFIRHSYSCRVGKGTLDGIVCVDDMLRQSSDKYSRDSYILRLDIRGFFFHINKEILLEKLKKLINENYFEDNKETLLYLLEETLMNNPINGCYLRSDKSQWDMLPRSKSLFFSFENCGLPIGNLTSQIFANFYLNDLDHYIESLDENLFYGRYVDDLVLVHKDRHFLEQAKVKIQHYLMTHLKLQIHPLKISLTHYGQGCAFIGAYIKPGRIYPSKRFQKAFFRRIEVLNAKWHACKGCYDKALVDETLSSINSYFGLLKYFTAFRIKIKAWNRLCPEIRSVFHADVHLNKIILDPQIKKIFSVTARLKYFPPFRGVKYLPPPQKKKKNPRK